MQDTIYSAVEHVQYTVTDLTTKLKWHDMLYQRNTREDREYIKRLSRVLEAVRRELRQEIDRAERKLAFFADKGKAERYEIERQSYQKILNALEYRERQRMD